MYERVWKRVLDFGLSLTALVILAPVLLVLMAVGAMVMKGNPFFTQIRPGKNEKLFRLIKFRSMTCETDGNGNLLPDEKRLTAYGRFLRASSLDELPELLNILKGDMAFIGPRPLLVQYLPLYNEEQHRRHDVTPGMSGWAQVNGRNNISWTKKFEYDVYYVDHIGAAMDRKVFFTTIKKVLFRDDINQDGGEWATMDPFNGHN